MTLDEGSIENAIEEIELFESQLKPAMQHLIDYLGEKGVEIARAYLLWLGDASAYSTGALSESIRCELSDGKARVIAGEGLHNAMGDPDSESYAFYVEYGNGANRPDGGWWYPAPWGWRMYEGVPYAWTNGMGPRPFMHNTLNSLAEEAKIMGARIIAEYIGG